MQRRTALIALPAALLAACAGVPRERPARFWSGRLALQVLGDAPRDLQAGFELQGTPERGELNLLGPLGTLLARLSWQPGEALLEQGEQRWSDESVDALALRVARTPLPLAALFDWFEGRPRESAGWTADLSGWAEGRIRAERSTPTPAARLRIVLER